MSASEARLYFHLQRAAHALKKEADARLKRVAGISTAQAAVIAILLSEGPCTQREIASRLKQRESAVTTMAERLIKAGYVVRRRCENDRRAWRLKATREGRNAHAAIRAPFEAINALLDETFPGDNAEQVAKGLTHLIERLNEEDDGR